MRHVKAFRRNVSMEELRLPVGSLGMLGSVQTMKRAGLVVVGDVIPNLGLIISIDHVFLPGFDFRIVGTDDFRLHCNNDMVEVVTDCDGPALGQPGIPADR